MLLYHIIAFSIGILLDLIIGDPYNMPHPIRLIGRLIAFCDRRFMGQELQNDETKDGSEKNCQKDCQEKSSVCADNMAAAGRGRMTVVIVLAATLVVTAALVVCAYLIHPVAGIVTEAILTAYILAAKSLSKESMKVYKALAAGDIEGARYAVSMIVGRDTNCLDNAGIARAAIETVAENTSDGVIAPLVYTCIGGPVLGMMYKAVNTMDSMIGYHNDRYEYYGRCAARLDDIVNFIPARISAISMIIAAAMMPRFSGHGAYTIFKRDRFNHKSPNSAQTESACAGALGIRLAGDASYFGRVVKKPYIGDDGRPVEYKDIARVNRLMFMAYALMCAVCLLGLWIAVLLGL